MIEKDKELLLKDLCTRLPYKVHCRVYTMGGKIREDDDILYECSTLGENTRTLKLMNEDSSECLMYYQIKPYLRPMSSMTEKEELDYVALGDVQRYGKPQYAYLISEQLDYLNANHFDYRGLIEKGLALEAPEGMYKAE